MREFLRRKKAGAAQGERVARNANEQAEELSQAALFLIYLR